MTKQPTQIDLTAHVKKIRTDLGLSQKDFADILGVTQSTVSKWESGNQKPDFNSTMAMQSINGENLKPSVSEHTFSKRAWGAPVSVVGGISETKWQGSYKWASTNNFSFLVPKRPGWEGLSLLGFVVQDDSADPVYPRDSILVCARYSFERWQNPRTGDHVIFAQKDAAKKLTRVVLRQFALGRKGEIVLNAFRSDTPDDRAFTLTNKLDVLAAGGFEALGLLGVVIGGFIIENPSRFPDP